jgi:hypothetical protein
MNARWQHSINFIAGAWLFASPRVLDYLDDVAYRLRRSIHRMLSVAISAMVRRRIT